ncbi:MAG: GCN5-related N-acetyltransferase [Pedosphaera sp.]|nr:GCN5-related N-acetyltransferase [Pedosphaera sp.]
MRLTFRPATTEDAPQMASLRTAVADQLTQQYGHGPWSSATSEKGALYSVRNSRVFAAFQAEELIAIFQFVTKKPWAIDTNYFTVCLQPLYLIGLNVAPPWQRRGVGRCCLEEAVKIARAWPADAIRLDAFAAQAGAGDFYARCGFRETGRKTYRDAPLIYFELLL